MPGGGSGGAAGYVRVLSAPGALAFAVPGLVGRLPLSMLGLGTVVLVERTYGGYALAGAVAACVALSQAVVAPLLGRLVDQRGQAAVLLPALAGHVLGLLALLLAVAARLPAPVLMAAALVAGGLLPPVSACVRARWSSVLARDPRRDPADLQTAFALEAVVDEVVFIVGPVLVTVLAVAVSPYVGLSASLAFVVVGTLGFVAARSSDPGPRADDGGPHARALSSAGLRVVVLAFLCVGALFGAIEVTMVAFADERGVSGLAGPLLACVAGGSLVAGLVYGAVRWRREVDVRFRLALVLLALGVVPLPLLAASSLPAPAMVPAGLLAGLAIAPTVVGGYALIERLAPPGALTEGFAWLSATLGVGVALGAAGSGGLVDAGGSGAGFLVPVVGGGLAALLAGLGRRLLVPPARPPVALVKQA